MEIATVTTRVISGFVKNFTGLGEILSAMGSMYDMSQIAKIMGMTDDE